MDEMSWYATRPPFGPHFISGTHPQPASAVAAGGHAGKSQLQTPVEPRTQAERPSAVPSGQSFASLSAGLARQSANVHAIAPASTAGQGGKSQKHCPAPFLAHTLRPTPVPSGQILASAVAPIPAQSAWVHESGGALPEGQAGKSQKQVPSPFFAQTVRPSALPSEHTLASSVRARPVQS